MRAAKITEVSRIATASPTLSSRVASITAPKETKAISAPMKPRSSSGGRGRRASGAIRIRRQMARIGKVQPSATKNQARNTSGSADWRMPQAS